MEIPDKFFNILTPLLIGTTYLSAFEGGKPTCQRFLINNFLYLLTSFSIYFTAMKVYKDENIILERNQTILLSLSSFVLILMFLFTENQVYRHIIWLCMLLIIAYIEKEFLKTLGEGVIEDTTKKMMIIIVICAIIALKFPHLIKPSLGYILGSGLLFVILFRIIDTFFLDRKYHDTISSIAVFLFSGFIIYDTNRVMQVARECTVTGGRPDYLENMIDMFLNVINLFNNLADVLD